MKSKDIVIKIMKRSDGERAAECYNTDTGRKPIHGIR